MKNTIIFIVLVLAVHFTLRAQYTGGNGRGDAMIELTNFTLPVYELPVILPAKYELKQNYPNPFNPVTSISYELPMPGFVKLAVYNILGEEVFVLINEYQTAGKYEVSCDASACPSGVYFYKLTVSGSELLKASGFSQTKKMVLIK